jgi:hypothetical protein
VAPNGKKPIKQSLTQLASMVSHDSDSNLGAVTCLHE